MTTYYVGSGGNNANAGTSWALRKLTLAGAEDIPVAAGDTVYVGPGTYRETLTCDVSGAAGSLITYIGDYTGASTDGTGGVVRITGSDNDQTATRNNIIIVGARNYRTFTGFQIDTAADHMITYTTGTNLTIQQCSFLPIISAKDCINGTSGTNLTVQNCVFWGQHYIGNGIYINTATQNMANTVQNCIFIGGSYGISLTGGCSGMTVKNCLFYKQHSYSVIAWAAVISGSNVVNNCIIVASSVGLYSVPAAGNQLLEDYNNVFGCSTARNNVAVGANSLAYAWLPDLRWFFEAVNGSSMLTPFDLASYSQLINVAGTSPTTTDMRGTAVQGAQREWGALEYDSTLDIEAGTGGGGINMPRVRVGH